MLRCSNRDVALTLRQFAEHGLDCGLIVPTATGLEKSILDATDSVRAWLREQGIHDYSAQQQGPDAKATIATLLFSKGEVVATTTSLYRPNTKQGDPRIWFGRLSKYATAGDLLAICNAGSKLMVVNTSQSDVGHLLEDRTSSFWCALRSEGEAAGQPLRVTAAEARDILLDGGGPAARTGGRPLTRVDSRSQSTPTGRRPLTAEALELLAMLKLVGAQGFLRTLRPGDTGVGYTLETKLGIKCNSSKAPDYKGIEIKAGRKGSHAKGRTTILSQVPEWKISRLKGSADILRARGRYSDKKGRRQLFHELSMIKPNSYGMALELEGNVLLHQSWTDGSTLVRDTTWRLETLFSRLKDKHGQTFWVKADTRGRGAEEEFHYATARYTSGVSEAKLPMLLEAGVITVDYTIKETSTGGAKDQGYLFKIRQADLPLLFKSPLTFDLAA